MHSKLLVKMFDILILLPTDNFMYYPLIRKISLSLYNHCYNNLPAPFQQAVNTTTAVCQHCYSELRALLQEAASTTTAGYQYSHNRL